MTIHEINSRYVLPTVEEKTAYGYKRQDPYTKLFEERIIFMGQPIDDTVANDVATVTFGMAASMGQFLLTSGAKGKRYATKSSRILMHQPLGGIGGTAIDIRIQAEQMAITKQTLSELNALHTGQSLEKILADSDRDNWFNAGDAKDYGFVDHVAVSYTHLTLPTTPYV